MKKQIAQFVIGLAAGIGACKFAALTYTLLADGQFFTTLLAVGFAVLCALVSVLFIMESFD
jgi:hypothetical protein